MTDPQLVLSCNTTFAKSKDTFPVCMSPTIILWEPLFGGISLFCSQGSLICIFKCTLNAYKACETLGQQEGRDVWGGKEREEQQEGDRCHVPYPGRSVHQLPPPPPKPQEQLPHCDLILVIAFLSYDVFYTPFPGQRVVLFCFFLA